MYLIDEQKRINLYEEKFNINPLMYKYVTKVLHKDILDFQEYVQCKIDKIVNIKEKILKYIQNEANQCLEDFEVHFIK